MSYILQSVALTAYRNVGIGLKAYKKKFCLKVEYAFLIFTKYTSRLREVEVSPAVPRVDLPAAVAAHGGAGAAC